LRRVAALGAAAAAATSSTVAAKASVIGAGIVTHLIVPGILGGVVGAVVLVGARSTWTPRATTQSVATVQPHRGPPDRANDVERVEPRPPTTSDTPPPTTVQPDSHAPAAIPRNVVPNRARPSASPPIAATAGPPVDAQERVPQQGASHGSTDLAAELDVMRQVHAALLRGEPERALAWLDARPAVTTGVFDEEAAAARISAFCQLGRTHDVGVETKRFLARWPRSPLSMKVGEGCASVSEKKR
jgi:hypothetical protein